MKIIYYILLFGFISCGKSTSKNQGSKEQNFELDAENKYWDSICRIETKNAEIDIKQNKLTYFHYFGMVVKYRSNEEMNMLLSKYNISIDSANYYCTVPGELQNCYAHKMEQEIDKRFGKNFIDSLRNVAEKLYVKNNPNKIYEFGNAIQYLYIQIVKAIQTFLRITKMTFLKLQNTPKILNSETKMIPILGFQVISFCIKMEL